MSMFIKAVFSIRPNARCIISGTNIQWLDETQTEPTQEEIRNEIVRLTYLEEVNEYQRKRSAEYPSYADQFDQIFHEGIDAWSSTIQAVKDKYPKIVMDQAELTKRQEAALFDHKVAEYKKAVSRLSQYVVSEGREEIKEMLPSGEKKYNEGTRQFEDILVETITQSAIEPLPATVQIAEDSDPASGIVIKTIRNPLIVQDEEERAAAQEIVDATPQEVKDAA